jgi:hypothetical protein
LTTVQDTDLLICGQLSIKLDVRESEQYGASNDVKGYKSNGAAPPKAAVAPAASAKAAPPWVKK